MASARRSSVLEGERPSNRSSSGLSSNPPQISPTSNPTSHVNTKHPRDPPQQNRQDHAEINPPPGLLQPIKHPRRQRLLRLSVRVVYLERWVNARDGVRDRTKAGREPVFVKTVAQPGPRVRDPARVLDVANSALESDGLQRCKEAVRERSSGVWREIYVRVQDRVIVHELPEHQLRIRFERGVETEEDLTVLFDGQLLDLVQPIWKIANQSNVPIHAYSRPATLTCTAKKGVSIRRLGPNSGKAHQETAS